MSTKVDILAFGAHSDDVECAASGVLLKHISMGKTVAIVDLTAGEMGSYGTVEERKNEVTTAARIMGVKYREQLNMPDGGIESNETNRLRVIEMIPKCRPDIVLANVIHDRHPDQANAAKLVSQATFLSGLKRKQTFYSNIEQETWKPTVVYHYIQDYFVELAFVVDITMQIDKKMEAILAFKSQFVDPKDEQPNSILGLIDQIKNMNSIYGRPINAAYAEGLQ